MLQILRSFEHIKVLKDNDAFWRYMNAMQRREETPEGAASDAEERLDLRAAEAIKALLERTVGPEEGEKPVHSQNWDWNDDRCRAVTILTSGFRLEVISLLREILVGEFGDFQIIVQLVDDWDAEAWGCLSLTATELAIQKNVAQAYAIAT
jgi:hypothetical protein